MTIKTKMWVNLAETPANNSPAATLSTKTQYCKSIQDIPQTLNKQIEKKN